MLRIWGRMSSINVKKVVWTAQELGLEMQRTEAGGLFGIVKTPEYVRLNPNSTVPVLEDVVSGLMATAVRRVVGDTSAAPPPPLPKPRAFAPDEVIDLADEGTEA